MCSHWMLSPTLILSWIKMGVILRKCLIHLKPLLTTTETLSYFLPWLHSSISNLREVRYSHLTVLPLTPKQPGQNKRQRRVHREDLALTNSKVAKNRHFVPILSCLVSNTLFLYKYAFKKVSNTNNFSYYCPVMYKILSMS